MLKNSSKKYLPASLILLTFIVIGCRQYDNFTTFYNTYYNANRLIEKSEDEFDYLDEKKRIKPHIYTPDPTITIKTSPSNDTPPFLKGFIISRQKLQPVKIKLDSVIIKGSKILAKHPKSSYIEGTLFLMAKSYFYRNEWLPAQIKCSELIDKYPDGELSPDAHLMLSKTLLIQRKFYAGKIMLSRTVDIAWQLKRYDILSEAFKLEAELALYQKDLKSATRPYLQAIAQTDDGEMRARWQVDLAGLYFRLGKFKAAKKAFDKVFDYSPDYMAEFEAYLYSASCLNRLGKHTEAYEILEKIKDDGKYEEWKNYVHVEEMQGMRIQEMEDGLKPKEKHADSAFISNKLLNCYYYERGMDFYRKDDFKNARSYFAKARTARSPVLTGAEHMYYLLNNWSILRQPIETSLIRMNKKEFIADSIKPYLATNLFEIGRIQEQLFNLDSAKFYYESSSVYAPYFDTTSARYHYAYSRIIRKDDPNKADSLLEEIVKQYPLTEYGRAAGKQLGLTEAFFIDTVADLYRSGSKLRRHAEYKFAIKQFSKIFNLYPTSYLAPKALYTVGWIYENNLARNDSAYIYYKRLTKNFPNSIYAKDLSLSLTYMSILESGRPLPDSLKPRKRSDVKQSSIHDPKNKGIKQKLDIKKIPSGKMQIDDLSDPSKVINSSTDKLKQNAKDLMDKPSSLFDSFELPSNPLDVFNSKKTDKADSSRTNKTDSSKTETKKKK